MLKNSGSVLALATLLVLAVYGVSISSQQNPHNQTVNRPDQNATQSVKPESADEKIAFYTEVLAVFTGILALVSSVQICFLYRADKITRITAEAAKKSAGVADLALRSTQRAMVISPGFNTHLVWAKDSDICGIQIEARWKNTGVTSALKSENWIVFASKDISNQEEIEFSKLRRTPAVPYGAAIGPGTSVTTLKIGASLEDLIDAFEKRKRLFVYSRAEYDDVFEGSHRHHTEVCAELIVISDPLFVKYVEGMSSNSFLGYKAHTSYNSAD
jgi:hypothetical protein